MPQIRVFVVDDSVVFRKLLLESINTIPGVRTVGVAGNGREAVEAIPKVKPDLITLDLNMPVMDGLETLRTLHEVYPRFQAVMVSSYTLEGAQATLKALEAGALDFITKPDTGDERRNSSYLRDQLASFIGKYVRTDINFHANYLPSGSPGGSPEAPEQPQNRHACTIRPEVVALAISTGGPNALSVLLPSLPANFPVPVLIVQHMPRLFTRTFAESLQNKSDIRVVEAADQEKVVAKTVYIAPGGSQMKVARNSQGEVQIQITDEPAENHCKPSADYLFRSVAQVYGNKALGVIMTGMGSDGVLGLRLMKRRGAFIIAQDRFSCTVWGMPRMAIEAGVVDVVAPLAEIGAEMVKCLEVR